jgi:hypothetical protein
MLGRRSVLKKNLVSIFCCSSPRGTAYIEAGGAKNKRRTISESRARAGSSVGGASLCLSTASSTSTNFHRGGLSGYLSILLSSTASWASVSQRLGLCSSGHSRASATAPTMRSKRCRPVMHCVELTMAWRMRSWVEEEEEEADDAVSSVLPFAMGMSSEGSSSP